MSEKITKNMTINEIFSKFPNKLEEISKILSDTGLHCVGCPSAAFESLENGFYAHGLNEKDVENAVEKLNKIIKN